MTDREIEQELKKREREEDMRSEISNMRTFVFRCCTAGAVGLYILLCSSVAIIDQPVDLRPSSHGGVVLFCLAVAVLVYSLVTRGQETEIKKHYGNYQKWSIRRTTQEN